MTLALRPIAHSEIGLVRKTNQDSGFVSTSMMLVADGMGGAAAGDFASAVAVRELRRLGDDPPVGPEALTAWKEAIHAVNAEVGDMIAANPRLDGMGTTICGGVFDGEEMHIAHIGDSRCYVLAEEHLHRLTHDHSYVQSLIDEGRLDEMGAMTHPHRSLLLKVLNGQPEIKPDFLTTKLVDGDRVMFCSDGLSGLVDDTAIGEAMNLPSLTDAMTTLIALAHVAGGSDNITIIMADVVEVKTLTQTIDSMADPCIDTGEHTLVFTPDPEILLDQATLPEVDYHVHGLIGAAADPRIISRIKAAYSPIVEEEATPSEGDHETTTMREKQRYHPTTKKKRRWAVWLVAVIIVAGLVAGGLAVRSYVLNQFYITENNGTVAIYQGLPGDIAGIQTSWLYEETTIRLTDLPNSWRDRVSSKISISSGGLAQARTTVEELRIKSQECIISRLNRPPDTPPPSDGC